MPSVLDPTDVYPSKNNLRRFRESALPPALSPEIGPDHKTFYCHLCGTYEPNEWACSCESIPHAHCRKAHLPALVLTYLPTVRCGATAKRIADDLHIRGVDARKVEAAIRAIGREFGIPYRSAEAYRSTSTEYWLELHHPQMRSTYRRICNAVLDGDSSPTPKQEVPQ